jgi:hypothetical protein
MGNLSAAAMARAVLPVEVLALLHECLSGLDELETLLLVRADPSARWTAVAVADALRLSVDVSASALERLSAAGLLLPSDDGAERRFSYRPATPELDAAVASLASIYGENGIDIIKILSAKAIERARAAVVTLGDAIAIGKRWTEGSGQEPG